VDRPSGYQFVAAWFSPQKNFKNCSGYMLHEKGHSRLETSPDSIRMTLDCHGRQYGTGHHQRKVSTIELLD
jgi:hypothetical protein